MRPLRPFWFENCAFHLLGDGEGLVDEWDGVCFMAISAVTSSVDMNFENGKSCKNVG